MMRIKDIIPAPDQMNVENHKNPVSKASLWAKNWTQGLTNAKFKC
jgi:hypothetical protein